jgi:hypothetical protein
MHELLRWGAGGGEQKGRCWTRRDQLRSPLALPKPGKCECYEVIWTMREERRSECRGIAGFRMHGGWVLRVASCTVAQKRWGRGHLQGGCCCPFSCLGTIILAEKGGQTLRARRHSTATQPPSLCSASDACASAVTGLSTAAQLHLLTPFTLPVRVARHVFYSLRTPPPIFTKREAQVEKNPHFLYLLARRGRAQQNQKLRPTRPCWRADLEFCTILKISNRHFGSREITPQPRRARM